MTILLLVVGSLLLGVGTKQLFTNIDSGDTFGEVISKGSVGISNMLVAGTILSFYLISIFS